MTLDDINQLADDFLALRPQHVGLHYLAPSGKIRFDFWTRQDGDDYGFRDSRTFATFADAREWVTWLTVRKQEKTHT